LRPKLIRNITGISNRGNKIAKMVYKKELPVGISDMEKDLIYWLDK